MANINPVEYNNLENAISAVRHAVYGSEVRNAIGDGLALMNNRIDSDDSTQLAEKLYDGKNPLYTNFQVLTYWDWRNAHTYSPWGALRQGYFPINSYTTCSWADDDVPWQPDAGPVSSLFLTPGEIFSDCPSALYEGFVAGEGLRIERHAWYPENYKHYFPVAGTTENDPLHWDTAGVYVFRSYPRAVTSRYFMCHRMLDISGSTPRYVNKWIDFSGDAPEVDAYTRSEADDKFALKSTVASKADTTYVNNALNGKANNDYVVDGFAAIVEQLRAKANSWAVYSRSEIDAFLSEKADQTEIPTDLKDLTSDSNHRTVTDEQIVRWNNPLSDLDRDPQILYILDNMYSKPSGGIPEYDLSQIVQAKLNAIPDMFSLSLNHKTTITDQEYNDLVAAIDYPKILLISACPTTDSSDDTRYLYNISTDDPTAMPWDDPIYVSLSADVGDTRYFLRINRLPIGTGGQHAIVRASTPKTAEYGLAVNIQTNDADIDADTIALMNRNYSYGLNVSVTYGSSHECTLLEHAYGGDFWYIVPTINVHPTDPMTVDVTYKLLWILDDGHIGGKWDYNIADQSISDPGGYFSSNSINGALQELGAKLGDIDSILEELL